MLFIFSLVLCTVLIAFYWPFLTDRASFYILDFPSIWYPFLSYMGERLRHGQLPLWNPYVLNGIPQTFSPAAVYPVNWLYAVLPFNSAAAAADVIQQLVGGIGMFLLVDDLGLGLFCAAFAGALFALGGWMFSMQTICILQGPSAWVPMAFWSWRRVSAQSARTRLLFTAFLAVVTFFLIVSGLPEVFAPALLILGVLSLLGLRYKTGTIRSRSVLCALRLVALVLGITLAAPVILPQLEWARLSVRSAGFDIAEVMEHSASWYDFACLVLSQPLGDVYRYSPYFNLLAFLTEKDPKNYIPYLSSAFIGAIPVTLAAWAIFDNTWRWRFWVLAGLLTASIAALGWHTSVAPAVVSLLHITSIRFPAKLLVWVVIPLILLATRGFWMLCCGVRSKGVEVAAVIWLLLLFAGVAAIRGGDAASAWTVSALHWPQHVLEIAPAVVATGREVAIASIIGLATVAAFLLRLRLPASKAPLVSSVVLLAAVVALLINAGQFNFHPGPADFYRRPMAVADAAKQLLSSQGTTQVPRICVLEQPPPVPGRVIIYPEWFLNSKAYFRQLLVRMTGVEVGLDNVNSPIHGQTMDNSYVWDQALTRHAAGDDRSLASVCKVCAANLVCTPLLQSNGAPYRLDRKLFHLMLQHYYLNVALYRLSDGMPRAYLAESVKWGKPHKEVVRMVAHPETNNFDPANLTVLEHRSDDEVGPQIDPYSPAQGASIAQIVVDEPEHVSVTVTTPKRNFLVLADQFYPGWQATVDGKRQPIYVANGFTRAVLVEKGRHQVDFFYRPQSVMTGFVIGACALLIILIMAVVALVIPCVEQRGT